VAADLAAEREAHARTKESLSGESAALAAARDALEFTNAAEATARSVAAAAQARFVAESAASNSFRSAAVEEASRGRAALADEARRRLVVEAKLLGFKELHRCRKHLIAPGSSFDEPVASNFPVSRRLMALLPNA
jgi:hypothetical protein